MYYNLQYSGQNCDVTYITITHLTYTYQYGLMSFFKKIHMSVCVTPSAFNYKINVKLITIEKKNFMKGNFTLFHKFNHI